MFTCRSTIAGLLLLVTTLASREAAAQSGPGPYYSVPSWDQTIPGTKRFLILTNFNSEAVLDYETGLVWERTPGKTLSNWYGAVAACALRQTGGRMGWRLPSAAEFTTLLDPSVPIPGPTLPAGHPFGGMATSGPGAFYWTATSFSEPPLLAWEFNTVDASGATGIKDSSSILLRSWCVRGPTSGQ